MDECCDGQTWDVTVGEVNITLHSHLTSLTPEVVDHVLTRVTARATGADVARCKALHEAYGA